MDQIDKDAPLAERMRPRRLNEVIGQDHAVGKGTWLRRLIEGDNIGSVILWGPPGSGKTAIARVIANETRFPFVSFSAVLAGVRDLKKVVGEAGENRRRRRLKTILFVDEIHRFNKAQQDAFLPHVEDGTIILIGATTENPSFEVIGPLLSRSKVITLNPLAPEHIKTILLKAVRDEDRGYGNSGIDITEDALDFMARTSFGDARKALNNLEVAVKCLLEVRGQKSETEKGRNGETAEEGAVPKVIDLLLAEEAVGRKTLLYDKSGEEHYNLISAFIKSMRGSDPDAAIYWLARMLEAGEEPLFLARRMVIFASEDIGNADPQAIQVAVASFKAFDFVGMPEGWIPLAQAATYLACAPKSNASYRAYLGAKKDVGELGPLPVPLNLRNAPTGLMRGLGYGKDYKYPHHFKNGYVPEQYLPDRLRERRYYQPTDRGYEKRIREYLEFLRKKDS